MADYPESLIQALLIKVREYPRFSNGETLRVSSKSKNDLQLAIKLVCDLEESLNIPLKANNFR